MDTFGYLGQGFGVALTPYNLITALCGTLIGTVVGLLPYSVGLAALDATAAVRISWQLISRCSRTRLGYGARHLPHVELLDN